MATAAVSRSNRRRGTVMVMAAAVLTLILIFAAFTVDVGYLALTKAELQNAADAAALGGVLELRDELRLTQPDRAEARARQSAIEVAAENQAAQVRLTIHANEDIVVGRLSESGEVIAGGDPRQYNAVQVRVPMTEERNGPLGLFFAPITGTGTAELSAIAIAAIEGDIIGFRPTPRQPHTPLVPFSISIAQWEDAQRRGPDEHSVDADTDAVSRGSDGLYELEMFTEEQNSPGNFGTLNIGRQNNDIPELVRQVREGISRQDLQALGGEIRLGDDDLSIDVSADPGHGGPIYQAAEEILGKPIVICLHDGVTGGGATGTYRVVGFAAVRIVAVEGSGGNKLIRIQPTIVIDETAIPGEADEGQSDYVYGPLKLVR